MTAPTRSVVALLALLCMVAGCSAMASAEVKQSGDNFGIVDINDGAGPLQEVPANPGTKALWAGTCDLGSASTANGGIGTAPAVRGHCIEHGDFGGIAIPQTWAIGKEPSWRLDPVTQAGAHPDGTIAFFYRKTDLPGTGTIAQNPDGNARTVVVKLPPGIVGSPTNMPQCTALEVQNLPPDCGPETQLGTASLQIGNFNTTYPIYNTEARDTITAEFIIGGVARQFNIPIAARGRTNSDYGVDTLTLTIPVELSFYGASVTLWGVPWSEVHDKFRIAGENSGNGATNSNYWKTGYPVSEQESYDPSWGPIKPFVTNPTRCNGEEPLTRLETDSWQNPGAFVIEDTPAPILTGCDKLEFDPSITLRPSVDVADSPSGLDVTLSTPQNDDPPASIPGNSDLAHDPDDANGAPAYWRTDAGLASAHLKNTTVHLPAGTSFNPAAANGLRGCTTDQIGLTAVSPKVTFNNEKVTCPDTSKIGTLQINSPLLPDPLLGAVYAAPQNDNPFPGSLTAIYLVAQDDERGLSVKLPGKVDLNPATGQISTTFLDNPQLPFDDFILHLKTGPRAPLNTPATCGQFENAADLIPWSFPDSGSQPTIHDPFPIAAMPNGLSCVTQPEDRTFKPGFEAGSTSTKAASYTDFVLNVTRRDGEQEISGVALDMAPGLTANLSETPYCPEADIAAARSKSGLEETEAASCPAASYIGRVDTLAGAGPLPLPTEGRLYLSGPYDSDGAGPKPLSPLSVTTIVPAIAGGVPGNPAFDLGNVVIRTGVNLEPQTAQVHIDTTDVPYIVGGVPLRIRRVAVKLDKPGFMLNPTNCEAMAVGGAINGSADPLAKADDILAQVSSRFQVDGCKDLPFKPKLSLEVRGAAKRGAYQQLSATLTPRPGDANLKSISVTLPHAIFLAQNHINTICTRVQFAAKQCPEGSIYGFARAHTPLLKDPLEGPVYLRSSSNPLPDLVLGLSGQVGLDVVGRIDSVNAGIRNSFEVAPDAPVSKFELTMKGGKKSLLVNSQNLCFKTKVLTTKVDGEAVRTRKRIPIKPKATVRYVAQNGIELTQKVPLVSAGCTKQAQKAARAKRERRAKG